MGSEKHFRKSRRRTVHKTCNGGHIPRFAKKKNSLQKIRVWRKKGSSFNRKMHRSAKCFLLSMSNDFFYRHNTLSVTEFPVFNIKCKTKLLITFIKNPSIYNILHWFAWTMVQTNRQPSVWCSKYYYFFIISCKILC